MVCIGRAFQRRPFQPCFFAYPGVPGPLGGLDRSIQERRRAVVFGGAGSYRYESTTQRIVQLNRTATAAATAPQCSALHIIQTCAGSTDRTDK